LHPAAVVSRNTNDVGFSRYSIELNSKEVLPGKCLEELPTALPLVYCVLNCCKWDSSENWWFMYEIRGSCSSAAEQYCLL
jgi:hypothetical protein